MARQGQRRARALLRELPLAWRDGRLTAATIRAPAGGTAVLRQGDVTREVNLAPGGKFTWDGR